MVTEHSEFIRLNVIRARRNNPCATMQQIGDRYKITRERVRQILVEAGKPTSAFQQTYLCPNCGGELPRGKQSRARQGKGTFCNKQCQYDYGHIKIACDYCGELKEYRIKTIIWHIEHGQKCKYFFCSKVCQGKWLGENYGSTGNHRNIRKRKWDYSEIYTLRDSTGWGAIRIGRALGIPIPTVDKILVNRKKAQQELTV